MPRSRRCLLVAGVIAGALHIFVYVALHHWAVAPPPAPSIPTSKPVRVRITSAKNKPNAPRKAPELRKPTSPAPARIPPNLANRTVPETANTGPSPASHSEKPPTRGKTHADWLPSSNWDERSMASGNSELPQTWTSPPTLVQATQPFAGKLDIPLLARMDSGSAKAVASIRRQANRAFHLEFLDGQPLMRAVLYEALLAAQNRSALHAMFDSIGPQLHVSLRLTTIKISAPPSREEEKLQFSDHRIVIDRTMYFFESKASILTLPDEEAERAKRRDRVHLQRLMDSPAYRSPLRNRELP